MTALTDLDAAISALGTAQAKLAAVRTALTTAPPPPPPPPPPSSGVAVYKGLCAYNASDLVKARDLAGCSYVRSDWPSDVFMQAAAAAGTKVLPILAYAHGHGGTDHAPPTDLAGWRNEAVAFVQKYMPEAVEPWNEPFLTGTWQPKSDPTGYLNLLKAVVPALWQVKPDLLVVVSLDTVGDVNTSGTNLWRKSLLAADTGKFLSDPRIRPSTHNYVQARTPTQVTPQPCWWDLDRFKCAYNDLKAHGHPNPQVWVTEYGWRAGAVGGDTVSEAQQRDYTVQAINLFRASAMVERAYCFYFKAVAKAGDPVEWNWLRTDGSARPVCAAVKAL